MKGFFCICKSKRTENEKKALSRREKRCCPNKINDKKTTKMLDKLMFEKTTGLGFVTRSLSNVPEDANLFVTKKFFVFVITDFLSNENSQRQKRAAALFWLVNNLHGPKLVGTKLF